MKRALILTVGTGTRPDTNIVRPLVKTIRHSHPDFVAFVASSMSKKDTKSMNLVHRRTLNPFSGK